MTSRHKMQTPLTPEAMSHANELSKVAQSIASRPQFSANIKTWQERMEGGSYLGMGCYVSGSDTVKTGYTGVRAQIAARDAEIADLRAALAAAEKNGRAQGGPENSTKSCVSPLGKGDQGGPEGGPKHAAVAVPDGWKLVPVEPTIEMINAGKSTPCIDTGDEVVDSEEDYRNVFVAMLAAAPSPAEQEKP